MTYKTSQAAKASCASPTLPAQLMPFSEPSLLLPGENLRDFATIRQMMVDDIQPVTNIEWLWTLDLVELSWEILRYRNLKNTILDTHRAAAIAAILQRLDGEGMPALGYADGPTTSEAGTRNGAKIQRLPSRLRGVYAEAGSIRSASMLRYLSRRESCSESLKTNISGCLS
jgi:hypothetical protein